MAEKESPDTAGWAWVWIGTRGLFGQDSVSLHPRHWLHWDPEWEGGLAEAARGGNKCGAWGEEFWGWPGWRHPCSVSAWPGPGPGRRAVAPHRPRDPRLFGAPRDGLTAPQTLHDVPATVGLGETGHTGGGRPPWKRWLGFSPGVFKSFSGISCSK